MDADLKRFRYMTTGQIAERLGVKKSKVLAWIRSGELVAVNLATKQQGQPRYHVSEQAGFRIFFCVEP